LSTILFLHEARFPIHLPVRPGGLSAKPDVFPAIIQPAFKAHCIKCHGKGGKVKGKVNLLNLMIVSILGYYERFS
jgi:hypothetical protein